MTRTNFMTIKTDLSNGARFAGDAAPSADLPQDGRAKLQQVGLPEWVQRWLVSQPEEVFRSFLRAGLDAVEPRDRGVRGPADVREAAASLPAADRDAIARAFGLGSEARGARANGEFALHHGQFVRGGTR